jgi:hypothetical protein
MTKWETSRNTHRNGTWSRNAWPKCPSLEIGFECWLLDIQISRSSDTFSDKVYLIAIRY